MDKTIKQQCKKCSNSKSETILVIDSYNKVVQGLLTTEILEQKQKAKFNDSS